MNLNENDLVDFIHAVAARQGLADATFWGSAFPWPEPRPAPPKPTFAELCRLTVRPELRRNRLEWQDRPPELPDPATWFSDVYHAVRGANLVGHPVRVRCEDGALIVEVQT